MRSWVLSSGLLALCMIGQQTQAAAIIIDHTAVSQVGSIPQATIDKVASDLSFYFSHASVGSNICSGLQSLNTTDSVRYPLDVTSTGGSAAPATVTPGRVYENARGNPGWQAKVDNFATELGTGWGSRGRVVLNKFCYIDPDADFTYYAVSNGNGGGLVAGSVVFALAGQPGALLLLVPGAVLRGLVWQPLTYGFVADSPTGVIFGALAITSDGEGPSLASATS